MIKIALSGLVGFALGATMTFGPVIMRHQETVGVASRAIESGPASVDPFALTQDAKDLPTTVVLHYF
jgi:hypothetical protein